MNYSGEDSQNAAPATENAAAVPAKRGVDSQSTTKRFVLHHFLQNIF